MITYAIGAVADQVLEITIDRQGNTSGERLSASCCPQGDRSIVRLGRSRTASCEFSVRVEPEHSGVVEIASVGTGEVARTLIPLGADRPFLESELPPSPGADGAYSQSSCIEFRATPDALSWQAENMGGRIALSARASLVRIALRLRSGNEGEFIFFGICSRDPASPELVRFGTRLPSHAPG